MSYIQPLNYADPIAPAYLKTMSDLVNGEEVSLFRFIPVTKHAAIIAGTESTNLQTNIQDGLNALNTYKRGSLFAPAGTYLTDQVIFPSNINFRGAGRKTLFSPYGSTITGNKLFLINSGASNIDLSNFQMFVSRATFASASCIFVDTSSQINLHDILISSSGAFGVQSLNSTNCDFERITVNEAQQIGIFHTGSSSSNLRTRNCTVSNTYTSHGIQNVSGNDHTIVDCTTYNCTQFGANMYNVTRGKIINHRAWDTKLEGINLMNCNNCDILNPTIFWTGNATWASTDFGMSIWGDNSGGAFGSYSNFNKVIGGQIASSRKSGFAIADNCQFNTVDGLTITNPNSLNEAQGAAVLFYGPLAMNNKVSNIQAWASNGFMRNAVNEYNDGTGLPSGQVFYQIDSIGHTGPKVIASATTKYIDSPTIGIGYVTGAGGSVTQATSKATNVTLNKVCGSIVTHNASLAGGGVVAFALLNSAIGANDIVLISRASGGTDLAYFAGVDKIGAGFCNIYLQNVTGGALAEAVTLTFVVIKAVAA